MPEAVYTVQCGFSTESSSVFTFGSSLLDAGVFGGELFSAFDGPYDDLNDGTNFKTREVTVKRGRDSSLDLMTSGQATVTVYDAEGVLNPANTASPLAGQVRPMRPLQILATFQGVTHPIFYGYLDELSDYDPRSRTATLTARDGLALLGRIKPVFSDIGVSTTGDAIAALLDATAFDGDRRSLDRGDDIAAGFAGLGSDNTLSLIARLLEIERGAFYFSSDGVATYRSRHAPYAADVAAVFAADWSGVAAGFKLESIRNRVTVTREGGTPQTAVNADSVGAYWPADFEAIESPLIVTDDQALALAEYLVTVAGSMQAELRGVELKNRSDSQLSAMLALELLDVCEFTEPRTGTSGEYILQSLEHRITSGGKLHTLTVSGALRTAQSSPFIFGSSLLDSGPAFTY